MSGVRTAYQWGEVRNEDVEASAASGTYVVRTVRNASRKPITSEPPSPMKMLAPPFRGQLKTRKPRHAPTSSARHAPTNHCGFDESTVPARNMDAATVATPAESPSMLSMKFIALVTTRNQRAVIAMESQGPPTCASMAVRRRVPEKRGTATAG